MSRKLAWTDEAWKDYIYWQSQDKKTLKRINKLIADAKRHPFDGIGKPEPLKRTEGQELYLSLPWEAGPHPVSSIWRLYRVRSASLSGQRAHRRDARTRATRPARSSSSAKVSSPAADRTAISSGLPATRFSKRSGMASQLSRPDRSVSLP